MTKIVKNISVGTRDFHGCYSYSATMIIRPESQLVHDDDDVWNRFFIFHFLLAKIFNIPKPEIKRPNNY
ncbi:hypothetical protein DERP_002285 [Dermatophagoides pteronyssinus]|uniref:Uncharacterized protein n=1 Tax=Dermatophagoides pteronyssinus TaxID=6956 RepID=A0ABQ8JHV7_DERPT|nr:hypothetical protein DERP_002285 [Dermatophagoides pteronyssinus]